MNSAAVTESVDVMASKAIGSNPVRVRVSPAAQFVTLKRMKSGFTLIELLVVIAVIGIIAGVVMSSVNQVRIKLRDAQRLSDLKNLGTAIQLYREDNDQWPCPNLTGEPSHINDQTHCLAGALVPKYIGVIPVDPVLGNDGSNTWGEYQYSSTDTAYSLRVMLEGQPVNRTASYPNGTLCADDDYPRCSWFGQDCVYVSNPGTCNDYWFQLGGSLVD